MVIRMLWKCGHWTLKALALGLGATVFAQTDGIPAAVKDTPTLSLMASAAPAAPAGMPWSALTPAQQEALAPLASTWSTLTPGHQKKWITLVQKYPELSQPDQSRLRSRMADWAALSPKDRELARLHFAETKKLSVDARVAHWEAYQALPESKKQELLEAAPKKPVGAAVAVKPVASNKLAEVPFTRKTPAPARPDGQPSNLVDRYTLLPQSSANNNSVLAPRLPAK